MVFQIELITNIQRLLLRGLVAFRDIFRVLGRQPYKRTHVPQNLTTPSFWRNRAKLVWCRFALTRQHKEFAYKLIIDQRGWEIRWYAPSFTNFAPESFFLSVKAHGRCYKKYTRSFKAVKGLLRMGMAPWMVGCRYSITTSCLVQYANLKSTSSTRYRSSTWDRF